MYPIKKGATDQTFYFTLRDSTNHLPKTDITVTDLDLYYVTHKAAISAKADATALAAADSAHSDNKVFNVGQGVYRIDFPDIWSGNVGETVQLLVVCTGVDTTFLEVMLSPPVDVISIGGTVQTANDNGADINDILTDTAVIGAAGAGLTAVPWNASWDAEVQSECADALNAYDPPTKGEMDSAFATTNGYIDTEVAAILADTNELQTDLTNGGRLDLLIDAIKAKTDNIPASPATSAKQDTIIGYIDTEVAAIKSVVDNIHDTDLPAVKSDTAAILTDTNELQTDWHDGGRLDLILDGASAPSAAAVADAVWDEAISGHLGAGSTGNALNAAGSAGDPWSTPLPGAYGSGTAGKIIGDNINASVSSRSSHSAADVWTVGTRTLTSFGTLIADIWAYASRTLTAISDSSGITTLLSRIASALTITGGKVDVNDKTGFSLSVTPPTAIQVRQEIDSNSTQLTAIKAKTDNIPAAPATEAKQDTIIGYIDTEVSAIKAKTDNLPASPANEATLATIAGYIDTEVAAIKAKTDNLPSDPADQSGVEAAISAAISPLATSAELSAVDGKIDAIDIVVDAVKVQTDKLAFTVANQVDVNIQSVNDTELTGDGSAGTPWGPA